MHVYSMIKSVNKIQLQAHKYSNTQTEFYSRAEVNIYVHYPSPLPPATSKEHVVLHKP